MSEKMSTLDSPLAAVGSLSPGALPGLLREIHVGRHSGTLRFRRGEEHASVSFLSGEIVAGGANIAECRMGVTFVRHGLIRPEQLDRALESSAASSRRLGSELLALGFLDEAALDEGLALHVREILRCVFAWGDGRYAFEELSPEHVHRSDRPLQLPTAEVILDAVWSIADEAVIRRALGDLDRALVRASDPVLQLQNLQLTPEDGFLLSRVDGSLTAREVLEIVDGGAESERSLFGLISIGMLEFGAAPRAARSASATSGRATPGPAGRAVPEPRPAAPVERARFQSRDPHEVLGVARDASPAELKAAYFKLVREYHPDAQANRAGDRREVEAIFTRINEAYRSITERAASAGPARTAPAPPPEAPSARPARSAPAPPPETPPPSAAPEAGGSKVEEGLRAAEERFGAGEHWEALRLVQELLPKASGAERRRAHHLAAKVYLRVPDRLHEAEALLRVAVTEDGRDAEAFFLLGNVYDALGDAGRARLMYRRVLALDPEHASARTRAGADPREGQSQSSLLARLFHHS